MYRSTKDVQIDEIRTGAGYTKGLCPTYGAGYIFGMTGSDLCIVWDVCVVSLPIASLARQPHPAHYYCCAIAEGKQTRQVSVSYAGMCAGQSDRRMKCLRLTSTFDVTRQNIFFDFTLDEDWGDSGLVRAAVTCVYRQLNTSADRASTPCVFAYILGIVGRVDRSWCESSTSSEATCSEEAEARFRLLLGVRRGAEELPFQRTQVSPSSCGRWRHIPRKHENLASLTRPFPPRLCNSNAQG